MAIKGTEVNHSSSNGLKILGYRFGKKLGWILLSSYVLLTLVLILFHYNCIVKQLRGNPSGFIKRIDLGGRVPEQIKVYKSKCYTVLHYLNEFLAIDADKLDIVSRQKIGSRWLGPECIVIKDDLCVISGFGEQGTGDTVALLDLKAGKWTFSKVHDGPFGVDIGDDRLIAVAHASGYLDVLNDKGNILNSKKVGIKLFNVLIIEEDGHKSAYFSDYGSNSIGIVSWPSLENIKEIKVPAVPQAMAVLGQKLAVACRAANSIVFLDLHTHKQEEIKIPGPPISLAFGPHGLLAVALWMPNPKFIIVDQKGEIKLERSLDIAPISIAWLNKDTVVISDFGLEYPGTASSVSVWDARVNN